MNRLTLRFEDGTKRPVFTHRRVMATARQYGVPDLIKDLRATLMCLGLAGLTLSSCASLPGQDSYRAAGLRPTLLQADAVSADSIVPKTSFARFAVLPASLDQGGPLLNSLDLRRGQDLMSLKPLDQQIVLQRYKPLDRDSAEVDTDTARQSGKTFNHAKLAAIGTPRIVRGSRFLQCVPFAREASGIQIFGNANRWWDLAEGKYRRAKSPTVGSVMVTNGYRTNRRGHVAVVRKVVDSRTIIIDHSNWLNDGKIYLSAPVRDVSENNDWSRVNVWYTPGQTWGSRVYSAKGFIRPNEQLASND
jgi:surface antigen